MKLELKNYLDTNLKMKAPYGFRPNGKESTGIKGIVYLTADLYADIKNNTFNGAEFKPILRPLSDLTKKYYFDNLKDGDFELSEEIIKEIKTISRGYLKFYQLNYLLNHHFDVFGLIEKGLAIDINTLNE